MDDSAPHDSARPLDGDEHDRPTLLPPFDVAAFARSATASGQDSQRSPEASTLPPPPSYVMPYEAEPPTRRTTRTNDAEIEGAPIVSVGRPWPSNVEGAIGVAIDALGAPTITERTIDDPFAEMRELFSCGDHAQAIELAEVLLAEEPGNPEARECRDRCRALLEQKYARDLGRLDRAPIVTSQGARPDVQSIDHRAGFVLSLVDGASTLETILDVCGMPKLDALRILHELTAHGIIGCI
jgi:hypothetical protein